MSDSAAEELAALRAMLREAVGPASDSEVSRGALDLRVKIRVGDFRRTHERAPEQDKEADKQRGDT